MWPLALILPLPFLQVARASGIVGDAHTFVSQSFDYLIVGGAKFKCQLMRFFGA